MKQQTTFFQIKLARILSCLILLLLCSSTFYGQTKEYATSAVDSGRNSAAFALVGYGPFGPTNDDNLATVSDASNAAVGDTISFAELSASNPMALLGGAAGEAWVQMNYTGEVVAGVVSYVRIGTLESSGFTLDIINGLLSDLLGLLSKNILIPEVYSNGGGVISSSNSIVLDNEGNVYVSVKPSANYTGVRLKLRNATATVLGIGNSTYKLKVYNTFNYGSATACDFATFTDQGKTTGISLNLGDVVKNPEFAIDDNTSSYSSISTPTVGLASSVAQNIYFPALSEANSVLKVQYGLQASTLSLNLLNSYKVRAYNGSNPTPVLDAPINTGNSLLGLDLLGLFTSGGSTTVSFNVTQPFDRVEIYAEGVLSVNLGSTIKIHNISRTSVSCPEPWADNPHISPVCANGATVSSANVDNASFATDNNFDSYASIRSTAGLLLGLGGSYAGYLEVDFPNPVPAGKTAYVRIDYDEGVLQSLLAGSIGNLVSGLVDGLLLGNHYFEVDVKSTVPAHNFSGSSANSFTDAAGKIRIVQDAKGYYYIAIKSDKEFSSIRITDKTAAVVGLLAKPNHLKVYNICYENSSDICDQAFATSYGGTGITLDLLNLGKTGVTNPQYAIDGNDATASEISMGLVSVAGSMSQYIHYNSLSDPRGAFKIKLALATSSLLDVDVLGAYEVLAYNGQTEVFKTTLSSGLLNGTDLLGLLGGSTGTMTFAPGRAFDRIEIRVGGLLGVGLLQAPVKVYDVKRFGAVGSACADPDFELPTETPDPFEIPSCEATVVAWDNANYPWLAADKNNESYATLSANSGALLGIGGHSGFLEYEFPTAVPAGKTTYIRIDMDGNVLGRLVGGTLGALIENVGGLLLGNHFFEVEAKTAQTGGTIVLTGSSSNGFSGTSGGDLRVVQDNIGRYYIAVTPSQAYKNIRITERFPALVGTTQDGATMKIFEACFEIGEDACLPAQFTSFNESGITLGVGEILAGAGVKDADHAISGNSSDYSEITTGTVSILGNVSQQIYFNKLSTVGDTLKVRMQMNQPSLLSAELLGRVKVVTYNKNQEKETFALSDNFLISNLDLLNLFNSGGIQTLYFETAQQFDRVDVVVGDLLNVALSPSVRLYEVKRFGENCPEIKEETPFHIPVCSTKLVAASNADDLLNLFDDDFGSYAVLNSGAGSLLGINQLEGFVELGYDAVIPAGTTSYIRIDFEGSLLSKLVSGSLGNVVSGLVDNLILGDHFFEVEVKNNIYNADGSVQSTTTVNKATSQTAETGGNNSIRVVQDYQGRYYIAVTPTGAYNAVRITDKTKSLLGVLAAPNTMNVYGMCYETSTDCEKAFMATSSEYSGLALTVTDLSGAGVTDANHAIDGNTTSASKISMGTLNIAGGAKQWIFLNREMSATEAVRIDFKTGTGAVDLNLLGNLQIKAYMGNDLVHTLTWGNGLINGINVLNLVNNGELVQLPYRPGVVYDRISVGMETGLVSASVFPPVELFGVIRCYDLTHLTKGCVISNPMLTNKIKK